MGAGATRELTWIADFQTMSVVAAWVKSKAVILDGQYGMP
jgi:hypothetical protein